MTHTPPPTQILDAVPARLHATRIEHGITLTAAAAATGISKSTLSRLEHGGRRATLELLVPLAQLYAVSLDTLVGMPPSGDPRDSIRTMQRGRGRTIVALSTPTGGIEAYKYVIPVATPREEPDPRVHQGFQWLFVVRGKLRVVLGEHDLVLGPGEVAEFSTRIPHWFGNVGDEPVECIALAGHRGERVRVRARPTSSPSK